MALLSIQCTIRGAADATSAAAVAGGAGAVEATGRASEFRLGNTSAHAAPGDAAAAAAAAAPGRAARAPASALLAASTAAGSLIPMGTSSFTSGVLA
jgi:hypothetical protein